MNTLKSKENLNIYDNNKGSSNNIANNLSNYDAIMN